MLTLIVAITFAMLISFTCSLLEATLLSLSTTDIAQMTEKKPRIARIWRSFKENIQRPIAVILIINTLSHTIGATVAGAKFQELFGDRFIWLFSLIFSYFMIQWTEILPKGLGVRHNRALAVMTGHPLKLIIKVFQPLVFVVELINRPFVSREQKDIKIDSVSDINILARFSTINNMISEKQENIIHSSLNLSTVKIEDIMIKRHEIKFLSNNMSIMDSLVEAHIHHHTRYPLIEGTDLDNVIGYVNFKDIVNALRINPKDPSLKGISRAILTVKPKEPLSLLLNRLTKSYQHIAIVKDEQNKTLGLVTLEDLFEFMIGDIQDEYDILPVYITQVTPTRFIIGGGVTFSNLNKEVGSRFDPGEITLNDWLKEKLRKTPAVEERYIENGVEYYVRKVRRSKVYEVIIETEKQQ